jgi:hypothetical protein
MMRRAKISFVLTTIYFAFAASSLAAQGDMHFGDVPATTDLTPSQRTFAEAYLAALTGSDIERYKRLLHPATRACMNKDNADYFDMIFKRRVGKVATSPRLSVEKLPEKFEMFDAMSARGWIYTVRPTHAFYIELATRGASLSSIPVFGALDKGAWYEVLPCPSAMAMGDLRLTQQKNDPETAKVRELAASMRDPLRAEVLALLKADKPVRAARRYAEAMHVDLTLAARVVDALDLEKL